MEHQSRPTIQKPFWDHVADLRRLFFYLTIFFLGCVGFVHYFHEAVISFLLAPLGDSAPPLQFLSPLEPLLFILKIDFLGALLLTIPFTLVLLYQFIDPRRWYKSLLPFVLFFSAALCALAGAAYSYYVIIPTVLAFMNSLVMPGTIASFTASGFLNFVLGTMFLLILIFQIPVCTVIAASAGFFNPSHFSKYRKNVYVCLFVATAVITPTTDVLTLLLVSVPALVITELGVLIGRYVYKDETTSTEISSPGT